MKYINLCTLLYIEKEIYPEYSNELNLIVVVIAKVQQSVCLKHFTISVYTEVRACVYIMHLPV